MEKAVVFVGSNLDGYGFTLAPETRQKLKEMGAHPSKNLFLSSDFRDDFMKHHGSFLKHVFPALAGFENEADAQRFELIEFVWPLTGEVFYRWNQKEARKLVETPVVA